LQASSLVARWSCRRARTPRRRRRRPLRRPLVARSGNFIVPSVSVGGSVTALIGDNSHSGYGVAARAGYNLNFTDQLGIWPIVGIGYAHESTGSGAASVSGSATVAHFYVPVLFHIVPRVFVGLGPFYDLKIAGDGNNSYGVRSTVGGWF
jgi:hypothetical protein